MAKIRELTVVLDDNCDECLYVDGKRWKHYRQSTIYAGDLVNESKGEPCILKHVAIDRSFVGWPETLAEALRES